MIPEAADRWDWVDDAVDLIVDDAANNQLHYVRWLPPQHAFLSDPSKRKLIRLGNQWGGKTTCALADVAWHCLGFHPFYDVPAPPVEWWIVCESWQQSVAIQAKLWALLPKEQLDPRTQFDEVNGFSPTKNPVVRFLNGSVIRIKTTNQGAAQLASGTIDGVLIDELTTARIYGELQKRVMKKGGKILLSLTPINRPAGWLQEKAVVVDRPEDLPDGKIRDHHYELRAEYLIPVGCKAPMRLRDGTPMDQRWIDRIRAETLKSEEPVAVDGEWEMRTVGRVFHAFDENVHVLRGAQGPVGKDLKICIGLDHGDGANFSQAAVLMAVDISGQFERVWVIDEYVSQGSTTPDMDAAEILAMLRRRKLGWHNVDFIFGDRTYPGQRGGTSKKSNIDLMKALARELGLRSVRALKPEIKTVKRGEGHGRGSKDAGIRYVHHAMVRPGHFHIHERCKRGIECILKWDYRDTSEYKHWIDGARYGLDHYIFSRPRTSNVELRLYA